MADMLKIKRVVREGAGHLLHVSINDEPAIEYVLTAGDEHGLAPALRELLRVGLERGKLIVEESV